jgi:hypothetical protein
MPLVPMTPNLFRVATDPFTATAAATMAQLAHQARRHGYHAPDRYTAYVICPQCCGEVHADPARVGGRSGDDRAVFPALDAAMLEHLPHCTNGA